MKSGNQCLFVNLCFGIVFKEIVADRNANVELQRLLQLLRVLTAVPYSVNSDSLLILNCIDNLVVFVCH